MVDDPKGENAGDGALIDEPDILAFDDYRAYLRAFYEYAKATQRGFSFRAFSRQAGFSSPNFLKLVIDGDRNLGPKSVASVARGLGLDPERRRYFERLVTFCQAETDMQRTGAYASLTAMRAYTVARRIEVDCYDYLNHWYYPVIREMTARVDFQEEPAWIAANLLPPIQPREAEKALETLLSVGFVERDEAGRLVRGEPTLATDPKVSGLAVRNYHRQMVGRGLEAMQEVEPELREIGATTVAVGADDVEALKGMVREFRRRFAARCDGVMEPEVVYQLNVQLFPLSAPPSTDTDTEEP